MRNRLPLLAALLSVSLAQAQWKYAREISIANAGGATADAVVEIRLGADFDYASAKAGGADVRIGATAAAALPLWIEQWNANGTSRIWVKVPYLAAGAAKLYLIYGNAGATSVSDGGKTFLFFDDFESGQLAPKWTNNSIAKAEFAAGVLKLTEADGQEGSVSADFEVTGKLIVRASYQRGGGDGHWTRGGIGGWNNWFCYGDHTEFAGAGTNYVMFYDAASMQNVDAYPLIKKTNGTVNAQWRRLAYWYDGTKLKGMQDTATVEWAGNATSSKLSLRTLDNDASDNYDFIAVSGLVSPEPVVTVGARVGAETVGLSEYGKRSPLSRALRGSAGRGLGYAATGAVVGRESRSPTIRLQAP